MWFGRVFSTLDVNVSRSPLKGMLIGSTAECVLETLPCDALVVKSPDFAQNLPF